VDRWFAPPAPEEDAVLDLALPAALDIGCGPARHALALAGRGVRTLGIDSEEAAVGLARSRGARVLRRSVFDRIPHAGSWGSALLLDGNVGIGGDPVALFARVRQLLRPGGRALIEVEAPGTDTALLEVRTETGHGDPSRWFGWAEVGTDDLPDLAALTSFSLESVWEAGGRWFSRLDAR
jgi:SAM-dependent methyltransferase